MTSGNGVVAAKALETLAVLGYDRKRVAAHIACHPRTVARWEAGLHQPSRRNRTALRALVGELLLAELAGPDDARTKARIARLHVAAWALMTTVEKAAAKAEQDEIAARLKADMQAAEQRRREDEAARYAEVRAQVAADRQARRERVAAAVATADNHPRSVTYRLADPWDALPAEPAPLPF